MIKSVSISFNQPHVNIVHCWVSPYQNDLCHINFMWGVNNCLFFLICFRCLLIFSCMIYQFGLWHSTFSKYPNPPDSQCSIGSDPACLLGLAGKRHPGTSLLSSLSWILFSLMQPPLPRTLFCWAELHPHAVP